jgi:phospholipase/carboxylesterase
VTRLDGRRAKPPSGKPSHLVVLLHGYGSNGDDLIGLVPYLRRSLPDALYVSPNAPNSCGLGTGFEWFPVSYDTELRGFDGIQSVRKMVSGYLGDLWEETGLNASRTILGGFSQGAMIALDTGLHLAEDLAGILSFSGGIPLVQAPVVPAGKRVPVFLAHGDADDIVPLAMSRRAHDLLSNAGLPVRLHISPGAAHTIAQDGLEAALRFLDGLQDGVNPD